MSYSINDVIMHLRKHAVTRVTIGIFVEYPLSRWRSAVPVISLGRWGKRYNTPYHLRNASVVLLCEEHQGTVAPITAVQICWKGWWRVLFGWNICTKKFRYRFANRMIANRQLSCNSNPIQVREKQSSGQCVEGKIINFYTLDLSGQTTDVFDLMADAKALRAILIYEGFKVNDLKFLARYKDIKWLALRHQNYVPKPFKQLVRIKQKEKAEKKIQAQGLSRNDELEAKDRLHPKLRWLWKALHFMNRSEFGIVAVLKFVFSVFLVGFWYYLKDESHLGIFIPYTGCALYYFAITIKKCYKYYKNLTSLSHKYLTRFSDIEESRIRQTEEFYKNNKKC